MREWIENLLELQSMDLKIRKMKLRKTVVPQEIANLRERMENERKELAEAKEISMKVKLDIKTVESKVEACEAEIQRLQKQSVMVKKNDEYRALMSEIEHQKKKISDLESEEIELWDRHEAAQEKFKRLESDYKSRVESLEEEIGELEELIGDLDVEIKKLSELRESQARKIDEGGAITVYSRILKRGRGEPLVPVQGSNCGNCHLKLTPQTINETRKTIVVVCDNCGHMLYMPGID